MLQWTKERRCPLHIPRVPMRIWKRRLFLGKPAKPPSAPNVIISVTNQQTDRRWVRLWTSSQAIVSTAFLITPTNDKQFIISQLLYVSAHPSIYAYVYASIYTYVYSSIHAHVYASIYAYVYTSIYFYVYDSHREYMLERSCAWCVMQIPSITKNQIIIK